MKKILISLAVVTVVAFGAYRQGYANGVLAMASAKPQATQTQLIGLAGMVLDQNGNPLKGVKVSAVGFEMSGVSNESGLFNVDLKVPQGTEVRVIMEKAGYEREDHYQTLSHEVSMSARLVRLQ